MTNVVSFPDSSRRLRREQSNYCSECGSPFTQVPTEPPTKSLGWKIVEVFWSVVVITIVLAVVF